LFLYRSALIMPPIFDRLWTIIDLKSIKNKLVFDRGKHI